MHKHKLHSKGSRGYSLLELVLALAIVAVLVGLLLPKGFDALRNARIQQVQKTIDTLKTAITDFVSMPGGNGSLPKTEGTGIPTTGALLTAASDTLKGNAARLDAILLAVGKIEKPIQLRMGSQIGASTGSGNELTWNQATMSYAMSPDAAPAKDWSLVTRLEARVSNPAAAPSAALGANFRLDGTTNTAAGAVVAYLVIPQVPATDAYNLALAINGTQLAPANATVACDIGGIAYAAPVAGLTDVYCYVTAL